MISGYLAAGCFLIFTGAGSLLQVLKLAARAKYQREQGIPVTYIAEGLQPSREMWGFVATLLFALSALTRSYLDLFLLFSRLPVLVLWTIILWYVQLSYSSARRYFQFAILSHLCLVLLIVLVSNGLRFDQTLLRVVVDGGLSVVGLFVFWSKSRQAYLMFRERRSGGVSIGREAGIALKDLTGMIYSTHVGTELLWVTVTHVLSGVSSIAISIAKLTAEPPVQHAEVRAAEERRRPTPHDSPD